MQNDISINRLSKFIQKGTLKIVPKDGFITLVTKKTGKTVALLLSTREEIFRDGDLIRCIGRPKYEREHIIRHVITLYCMRNGRPSKKIRGVSFEYVFSTPQFRVKSVKNVEHNPLKADYYVVLAEFRRLVLKKAKMPLRYKITGRKMLRLPKETLWDVFNRYICCGGGLHPDGHSFVGGSGVMQIVFTPREHSLVLVEKKIGEKNKVVIREQRSGETLSDCFRWLLVPQKIG
ncbi:MAG: hypothetical protein V1652_01990 [bacterium]